jgi:hypothetical protein
MYEIWRVFENRLLRRMFGSRREGVTGCRRIVHNEELQNLDVSPNVTVIKSRRMSWVGHVARMGEMRNITHF